MLEQYLGIGELDVSNNSKVFFKTTVGSCIAICLYDKGKKIGGMAHIMLPESNGRGDKKGKYADTAINELIHRMLFKFGAKRKSIIGKIIGGSNMFPTMKKAKESFQIGERNISAVKDILKKEDIMIISTDLGESCGRTVFFYIESGKVFVRKPDREKIEL